MCSRKKKTFQAKYFQTCNSFHRDAAKAKVTLNNKSAVTNRVVVLEMLTGVVVTATAYCVRIAAINTERM